MFGGGGMDPRKMEQMMQQMGIDTEELDAEEVIIRTAEEDLVFDAPDVTKIEAQGQQTYQIVGEPDHRERGSESADASGGDTVPDEDVEIVAQRAGVTEAEAREALQSEEGDLAAAIARLE